MIPSQVGNKVRLIFHAPSRGLIGYHSEFLTDTRGTGVMNRIFYAYEPYKGDIDTRRNGVLISSEAGTAIAYSLWKLQDRGPMFIDAGVPVYVGMIIGEHTKSNDLEVNPTKAKQLTNIRAAGKDEAIDLVPPRKLTLEQGLSYIQADELLEVTPKPSACANGFWIRSPASVPNRIWPLKPNKNSLIKSGCFFKATEESSQ